MALLTFRKAAFATLLLSVAAIAAEGSWWGEAKGGTSYNHLALPTETRAAALAGASAAWNGRGVGGLQPAALQNEPLRLTFNRTWLPQQIDATLDRVELVTGSGRNGFSFAGEVLDYNDFDGYDDDGRAVGKYGAGAWRLAAGWGRSWESWSWGVEISGGRFEIEQEHSWMMVGSMGIVRSLPAGFRLGTVFRNVGWATPFIHDEPSLPTEMAVGLLQQGSLSNRLLGWSGGVEARRRNGEGLAWIASAELLLKERVAFRVGYPFGEDHPSLSGGLGVRSRWIDADYSIIGDGLYGLRHQLALSLLL